MIQESPLQRAFLFLLSLFDTLKKRATFEHMKKQTRLAVLFFLLIFLAISLTVVDVSSRKNIKRSQHIIAFNDRGEVLVPWEDKGFGKEWHFFEALFEVEIPLYSGGVDTGDKTCHIVAVLFTEDWDKSAFRENYLWAKDFAKTERLFEEAVQDYAKEKSWFWDELTDDGKAPQTVRCSQIP